ncbi:MAG: anthranilate synthase component I [Candidatus Saelkia tenebricola]|nr:anthranilate synthase component I [Candidatus Saelkia tenebricola]
MKITPSYQEFLKLSKKGNLIPIYAEVLSDITTPFSLLERFKDDKYSFLLESIAGGEHIARYSFVGTNPYKIITHRGNKVSITGENGKKTKKVEKDFLDVIKNELSKYKYVKLKELPRFCGGFVGYISYDTVRFFEKIPGENPSDAGLFDSLFMEARDLYVFDHIKQRLLILTHISTVGQSLKSGYKEALEKLNEMYDELKVRLKNTEPKILKKKIKEGKPRSNFRKEEFLKLVKIAKRYISKGEVIQVVLSQRFNRQSKVKDREIYRWLRFINPSPYMFYLHCNSHSLIGSSPEVFVRCEDGIAELRPIAGTRKRGYDEAEDLFLEKELLKDAKERAEHIMLVDLGRNDLGRVCEYGTVKVPEFMAIEKYSHVMHIVSKVTGKMKKGKDMFDLIRASFPAGTVTGAPKIRAMEIIDELEPVMRGPYAGSVGYFSYSGNLDTCITIRTIVKKGNNINIQAGAGIVADSNPDLEYKECINKAKALNKAVDLAEGAL